MSGRSKSARDLAVELLGKWSKSGGFADALLSEGLDSAGLSARDKSLAAELFLGVIRRRGSLDCVLGAFCSRPVARLGARVRHILRLGAYQIIFLERVPSYAAVDCAVRQAKKLKGERIDKLVNGTLRSLDRSLAKDIVNSNEGLVRQALPVGVDQWRYFDQQIFAGAEEHPGEHLAQVYSCPGWLGRRWWGRFGLEGAGQVALAAVLRGPLTLRPNVLRTSQEELIQALGNMGLEAGGMAEGPGVWVRQMSPIQNQLFLAGHFQPQGPTAMRVGEFSQVREGQKVLDFCAGLGTKATHLAELMGDKGLVVASDVAGEKLRRAGSNAGRLGISCMEFVHQKDLAERFRLGSFDVVLVDVPCSNTGVLANRPDAKWRIELSDLGQLTRKQMKILQRAAGFVGVGGSLIYSTCSIEPVENDKLAAEFGRGEEGMVFEKDSQYLPRVGADPGQGHDGGYMARWCRK